MGEGKDQNDNLPGPMCRPTLIDTRKKEGRWERGERGKGRKRKGGEIGKSEEDD